MCSVHVVCGRVGVCGDGVYRDMSCRQEGSVHVMLSLIICYKSSLPSTQRLYRRKPGMAAIASKLPHNLNRNRYRDISACEPLLLTHTHTY